MIRIGIVGYGYVGRATAHAFGRDAEVAWHDPAVAGSVSLPELARGSDVLFVCVPTPTGPGGAADLSAVEEVFAQLAAETLRGPVVVRSTVPPGTCERLAERWRGLRVAFCPEFLREQHALADAERPARIVVGWTRPLVSRFDEGQDRLRAFFLRRLPEVPLCEMSATEAEIVKVAANALFATKVSFANEMAELTARLGGSWETVRRALVLDPRVGDGHLTVPGPDGRVGFGGSCLPKDLAALLAVAERAGVRLEVVEAAQRANRARRPA